MDPIANPALARMPQLERLLTAVRRRATALVLARACGALLAASSAALGFAWLADRVLGAPRPLRLALTLGLALALVYLTWRLAGAWLLRRPARAELALLVERAHPELRELFVSAVDFERTSAARSAVDAEQPRAPAEELALRARVCAQADERARGLAPASVLPTRTRALELLAGVALAALVVLLARAHPLETGIFAERLLGGTRAWPQATALAFELELPEGAAPALEREGVLELRLARGSDLGVAVRAQGAVPDEVELHFESGEVQPLARAGAGLFRASLRGLQQPLEFWAVGGDERDGYPRVRIDVLDPPDVERLAIAIEPPAYTGASARLEFDRDVEVLAGSRLAFHVLPRPAHARGHVRVLPADERIELAPRPFPAAAAAESGAAATANAAPAPPSAATPGEPLGLGFERVADRSLRLRFELNTPDGLSNPDPGLWSVNVVEDRPPQVELYAPGRSEVKSTPRGALALRLVARDDFGLQRVRWSLRAAQAEQPSSSGELELAARGSLAGAAPSGGSGLREAVASARLELEGLPGAELGAQLELRIEAVDGRQPEPQTAAALPIAVRIVAPEELLRLLQDQLGRTRVQANALADLQRARRLATEDLLAAHKGDAPLAAGDVLALQAALTGQRRVESDAQALTRELCAVAETALYARLDEKAGAWLEALDRELRAQLERSFEPAAWQRFRAQTRGASAGFAGYLLELVDLALAISEEDARAASAALDRAQGDPSMEGVREALVAARAAQDAALQRLESLLERLAEWDNFQSVVNLTRDILEQQKALRERTRQTAAEAR